MFHQSEKNILFIIRYAPILLIIFLSILITSFIDESNKQQHAQEINRITEFYKDFNNDELKEETNRVYTYIETEDKNGIKNLKISIKKRVYEAHEIATNIYEYNKHDKSTKEILELIRTALRSIIFNQGRGYYFMNDINGYNLLQPLNTLRETA